MTSGEADDRELSKVALVVLDFDGVLTDNCVWISHDGVESVRCWRSDGIGLTALQRAGIKVYILSTEVNKVVTVRAEKLKVPCLQAIADKGDAIGSLADELAIPLDQTMFVGNDVNDLPALNRVGFPVAVADAYPELDGVIRYRTTRPGGFGAVREICDRILAAREVNAAALERQGQSV